MSSTPDLWSETILVTPAMARHWREVAHFSRQRKLDSKHVARLAREMSHGHFIPGSQVYFGVYPNGDEALLNGNHTLEGVAHSGQPQVLTVTKKKVADEDEAGRIYAVFDIHKARSWLDSLKATGIGDDVDGKSQALAALGIMENRFEQFGPPEFRVSRHDRMQMLERYKDQVALYWGCMNSAPTSNTKFMKRAAIMSVGLAVMESQPTAGVEFFRGLAFDDAGAESPQRALLNWLRNVPGKGSTYRAEAVRATSLAWNAAFERRDLQVCKPNANKELRILGTAWSRGVKATVAPLMRSVA